MRHGSRPLAPAGGARRAAQPRRTRRLRAGWARPPSGAGRRRHLPRALPRPGPAPLRRSRRGLRRAGLPEQPLSLRGGRRGAMWLLWLLLGSAGECGRGRCPGARGRLRSAGEGAGASLTPRLPGRLLAGRGRRRPPLPGPLCLPSPGGPGRDVACACRPRRPSGRSRPQPQRGERRRPGARSVGRGVWGEERGAGRPWAAAASGRTGRPSLRRAGGAAAPLVHPGAGPFSLARSPRGEGGRGGCGRPSPGGRGKRSGRARLCLGCGKGVSYFLFVFICIETLSPRHGRHMPVKSGE